MRAAQIPKLKPLVDFDRGVSPFSRDSGHFWREPPPPKYGTAQQQETPLAQYHSKVPMARAFFALRFQRFWTWP